MPAEQGAPDLAGAGSDRFRRRHALDRTLRLSDAAVLAPVNLAALGVIPIDGLAAAGGELWVFGYGQAVKVDPAANQAQSPVPLPGAGSIGVGPGPSG